VVGTAERICCTYQRLANDVQAGDRILMDDGRIRLKVLATHDGEVTARVEEGGPLGEHKGINLPGVAVSSPAITDKDRVDMAFGLSALFTPFPRARFSPYLTGGVLGRQVWSNGWSVFSDTTGFSMGSSTPQSRTNGAIVVPMGIGIRARIAGRQFQIEYRVHNPQQGLTLGTRLPF